MALNTILNGMSKIRSLPPRHRAESSRNVTTTHPSVAGLEGLSLVLSLMLSAVVMFLLLLVSQLKEDVLETNARGVVIQYRYLRLDQG
jgi:hypothetical protein